MEEQVGALWHKLITRAADQRYPAQAVTLEQIKTVAQKYLRPETAVVAVVKP